MINQEQDQLDRLLHDHLARELDGQLGKSRRGFMQQWAGSAPRRHLTLGRMVGFAAAVALAAGLALWAGGLYGGRRGPVETNATQPEPAPPAAVDVRRVVIDRVSDEGTIGMGQGVVARKYRRQIIEQTQWIDPQTHALRQDIRRQNQIVLIGSQTY